jgi:hypothetical protein
MHAWGYVKNRKKRLGAVKVFIVNSFFRAQNILASSLMSNRGAPMGNLHSSVLVPKSAFTYTRKNVLSGGPRDTSSTSRCLSVWAKNIIGSSLMKARDGQMGQTAYRHVRLGV